MITAPIVPDQLVDITIRGARVDLLGESGVLLVTIDGVHHQILIPTRDDNGTTHPAVTVSPSHELVIPLDKPIDYYPVVCPDPTCSTDHTRLIHIDDDKVPADIAFTQAPLTGRCYWREGGYYTCQKLAAVGYIFCDQHVSLASLSEVQR